MQTILGAGGIIGRELARSLPQFTDKIRLVSRNPEKVNKSDELFQANLINYDEVIQAVEGSEIVYLTAGLAYKRKIWRSQWSVIMENVINACLATRSKLVFFDNIYAYEGSDLNPITEEHIIKPSSVKGAVRASLISLLKKAADREGLEYLIARSADFYGPGIKKVSLLTESVFNPLYEGKTANWIGSIHVKHSFTYTPDAGKATALLGNTPDAFGQVWHLPTAGNPLTGEEWVNTIAKELGTKPKLRAVNKTMLRMFGIFVPVMREFVEMYYQYDKDYVFSSKKFEDKFDLRPTPYFVGVKEIIKKDYQ